MTSEKIPTFEPSLTTELIEPNAEKYHSHFTPSQEATELLNKGRILAPGELPHEMIERVVDEIARADSKYENTEEYSFVNNLGSMMDNGQIVLNTTILTNAGRHKEKPLGACTVPTVSLRHENWRQLREEVLTLHRQGMGTGFCLDEAEDPIETLLFLNNVAKNGASSGAEDRPVGNMGTLSIYHPSASEFISAKADNPGLWKFNTAVDVDDNFISKVRANDDYELSNGRKINTREQLLHICRNVQASGDPGLIFLDRLNGRNPAEDLGRYKTVAPCAEVGLLEGEVCQFGYINIGKFVEKSTVDAISIDKDGLEKASRILARALDSALDITRDNLGAQESKTILEQKRKIGIGVCGVADALASVSIPYNSEKARELMRDIYSLINYSSKIESYELGKARGSCGVIAEGRSKYFDNPPQMVKLFADKETHLVSSEQWQELSKNIADGRCLRNISTTAIPPTGRSALVVDASTGIEPYFNLNNTHLGPNSEPKPLTAIEISPADHIAMAGAFQVFCDESVSKTINLPGNSTVEEIMDAYLMAYDAGLNGITVYVDGSMEAQPKKLNNQGETHAK